jgi:hypothetical protein
MTRESSASDSMVTAAATAAAPTPADAQLLDVVTEGKSAATRTKYASMIKRLLEVTGEPTLRAAIGKPTASYRHLAARYTNLRALEGFLSLINVICAAAPDVASKAAAGKWRRFSEELAVRVQAAADNNVVSEKLSDKWVEYSEIGRACEALRDDLAARGGGTMKESQALVLLGMYAYLPPKRADLGAVKVVRCKSAALCAAAVERCVEGNACVVGPTSATLVLNEYKTHDVYGQFTEDLPAELFEIVRDSLAAHPRAHLLSGTHDRPLSLQSTSNRVVQVMKRYVGSELSINDLRHIYITQTVRLDKLTVAERGAIARSMMHSPGVQLQYVRVLP